MTPPRLAERLLGALLPVAWRETVLGDLHEAFAERAHASGWRARWWYLGEALRLLVWGLRSRLGQTPAAPSEPTPRRSFMEETLSNVRFALRGLRRRPGMSLLTIATLAVALAANAAVFSVLDALLLRPLDFPQLDRMVRIWSRSPSSDALDRSRVSQADFLDWQATTRDLFTSLVAIEYWDATVRGALGPQSVQGFKVSPDFFELLGVRPVLGRGLSTDPARTEVVLSHDLWQKEYAGDAGVLGRPVVIDGTSRTIVGIAPPGFHFPDGGDAWAAVELKRDEGRDKRYMSAVGRLQPGKTFEEARERMATLAATLAKDYPATNQGWTNVVVPFSRGFEDQGLRPILAVWQTAAALLLLIACVNVANLMLARGEERREELALRVALGAGRGRVVRQLVTEGLILALSAAALSLPLASLAAFEIRSHMPAEMIRYVPGWNSIDVDGRTLLFSALTAMLAALLFSVVPALRASHASPALTLREGGRSGAAGAPRQFGRSALVVTEVACALALLIAGGLALRAATRMLHGPQGLRVDGILTLDVAPPEGRYADATAQIDFDRRALAALQAIPGVVSVAQSNIVPGRGYNNSEAVYREGDETAGPDAAVTIDQRSISPGYFGTLEIPILAGRGLLESDTADSQAVAVVNRAMADRLWPGQDPLGKRFHANEKPDGPLVTVVGVCGNTIHHWFARRNFPTFYRTYMQDPKRYMGFVMRVDGEPDALIPAARKAMASVDPELPANRVMSLATGLEQMTVGLQFAAAIMAVLAGLALILAVTGVYGVMAYRMSLREAEFGVRMALGASPGQVFGLAIGQGGRLTAIGLVLGVVLALALSSAANAAFEGALAPDATAFAGLTLLLALAALAAALVAALRTLRVDPVRLLRSS